jgi:hypothetical protein
MEKIAWFLTIKKPGRSLGFLPGEMRRTELGRDGKSACAQGHHRTGRMTGRPLAGVLPRKQKPLESRNHDSVSSSSLRAASGHRRCRTCAWGSVRKGLGLAETEVFCRFAPPRARRVRCAGMQPLRRTSGARSHGRSRYDFVTEIKLEDGSEVRAVSAGHRPSATAQGTKSEPPLSKTRAVAHLLL